MMGELVVIDGTAGGGQMLRNAVALSAVSGRAVRVTNIRGARPRPGLRPQHLMSVKVAAEACGADLVGGEIGSLEVEFRPGASVGGREWQIDVGTAGSLTLVLQCLLPALAHAQGDSSVTLIGGTDVPFAPPIDYLREVFAPALAELGPKVEVWVERRGFYPKGGGEMEVAVGGSPGLAPVSWTERGALKTIRGRSYSLGLPGHIAERMREAAMEGLREGGCGEAEIEVEVVEGGRSEGCGIALWAECEGGRRLGGSALGRRGKRAEEVGREAAEELVAELEGGGAVDSHLADQLVVWLALAEGRSEFTASRVTEHLRLAVEVAEAMVGCRFMIEEGRPARVVCDPRSLGG